MFFISCLLVRLLNDTVPTAKNVGHKMRNERMVMSEVWSGVRQIVMANVLTTDFTHIHSKLPDVLHKSDLASYRQFYTSGHLNQILRSPRSSFKEGMKVLDYYTCVCLKEHCCTAEFSFRGLYSIT